MEAVIAVNSLEEYIGAFVNQLGFECAETEHSLTLHVPARFGEGYMRIIHASDHVEIGIMDMMLNTPIVTDYQDYDQTCEATYCLAGHISYAENGTAAGAVDLGKHELGIFAVPRTCGRMLMPAGERIVAVSVGANECFRQELPFADECVCFTDPVVRELLYGLSRPVRASARVHNRFGELIDNEISTSLQRTYLDGMGKVLVADLWQEKIVAPLAGMTRLAMDPFMQKALLQAREILSRQYLKPPTTAVLARMVALNEHSLKSGFRQMFGRSMYEFVRMIRMENACYLMENETFSIGEIAAMVGYVNSSHFARAFRNEYGMNPSEFRFGS